MSSRNNTKNKTTGPSSQEKMVETWLEENCETKPDASLLLQENKALKSKLLRGRGLEDVIFAAVKEVYAEPKIIVSPPPPSILGKSARQEVAVLHICDVQFGKRTRSYDHVVATERLQELAQKTVEIANLRRNIAKIEEILVVLGGDIVENERNYPSQPHHISLPVIDQATKQGPEAIESVLRYLLKYFTRVRVTSVVGNHGRNGPFGQPGVHEKTNWDRVLYRVLEYRMLGSEQVDNPLRKRLIFNTPDTFWAVEDVCGWNILLVHGDQIKGGFAGFPWYGAAKKVWGWIDAIGEPFDYIMIGHFHTFATATLNYRILLANGTVESDNDYAQEELAACGYPCQRLSFFNAGHGLIADHQIFLTSDRAPQRRRALKWNKK